MKSNPLLLHIFLCVYLFSPACEYLPWQSGSSLNYTPSYRSEALPDTSAAPEVRKTKLRLAFVGDLMCHQMQYEYAKTPTGAYDFNPSFEYIRPYLQEADICFGNLETVFAGREDGRQYSGHPAFNSPDSYATALKQAGFDLVFTANNHAADRGHYGIKRTLSVLDSVGIQHAGSYASLDSNSAIPVFEWQNLRLVVLAYTDPLNSSKPSAFKGWINRVSKSKIEADLTKARALSPDLIIVHYHFGKEYERTPNQSQKQWANWAFEHGADLVIGEHPHVLQPLMQVNHNSPRTHKGVLAYSLGNFIAHQFQPYTNASVILFVEFERSLSSQPLTLVKSEVLPIYTSLVSNKKMTQHVVFPSQLAQLYKYKHQPPPPLTEFPKLKAYQWSKMQEAYLQTTTSAIQDTNGISLYSILTPPL